MSFLFGSKPKTMQFQNYNPMQQQAMSGGLSQAMAGLGLSGGQDLANAPLGQTPIEKKAMSQFYGQIAPGLAERFTSMGDSQNSSAFQGAMMGAGAGLAEDLGALRQSHLMNLLNIGLTPQFENVYQPRQPGFLENLGVGALGGLSSGLGSMGGMSLGSRLFGNPFQQASSPLGNLLGNAKVNPQKLQALLQYLQ